MQQRIQSQEVLDALGEEYSPAILEAADAPKSARELSEELDVPIATCYRRIESLVEVGLLEEAGRELSDRGRRTSVYRRTVDEVAVSFEEGLEMSANERTDPPERIRDPHRPHER